MYEHNCPRCKKHWWSAVKYPIKCGECQFKLYKEERKNTGRQPEESETSMENSHITVDPKICSGKPCIRGTRIMVTNILGMMAGGYSTEQVLDSYPELTKTDVSAALEYASQILDEEKIIAWR